jgi:hypothetical protein
MGKEIIPTKGKCQSSITLDTSRLKENVPTLSEFGRVKVIGIPSFPTKVHVKGNFVSRLNEFQYSLPRGVPRL